MRGDEKRAKGEAAAAALERGERLSREQWGDLFAAHSPEFDAYLAGRAAALRDQIYGRRVFVRGLIEFTNYCKNDCYYCGIRRENKNVRRYRLTGEEILACCRAGYELGFRTFVLQGGEDPYFTDQRMEEIIREVKGEFPGCALTLSIGERPRESYQAFRQAGADRYLLRHETANGAHYRRLHPPGQTLKNRMDCLYTLKELGYQTGAGMMVGSPGQTVECLIDDLMFLGELQPEMVGIGPFIPHHDTPFKDQPAGSVELTLFLLSLVRLMLPGVLLPATTALGTAAADGRARGILAGANVVMPNLSPERVRGDYQLYDNKVSAGLEAAEGLESLRRAMADLGYEVSVDRGDHISRCPGRERGAAQESGRGYELGSQAEPGPEGSADVKSGL